MIRFYLMLLFLLFFFKSIGQVNISMMSSWQDSLSNIGQRLFSTDVDPKKLEYNAQLVKTLVSSLKEAHSFDFDFDELTFLSRIKSSDEKIRIFSWDVPLSDGSYLYYGAIQMHTADGTLQLVPLLDQTFEIENPEVETLLPSKWYGARYYDIITYQGMYILLGWKGHSDTYTKKVIEPLIYNGTIFTLGAHVFSDDLTISRKVFNYTQQASMYLKYHSDRKQIVFDHIAPADPSLEGNYKYYGPDLSFDAYELVSGRLELRSDIDFQNPVRGDEDRYLDPTKVPKGMRSGL